MAVPNAYEKKWCSPQALMGLPGRRSVKKRGHMELIGIIYIFNIIEPVIWDNMLLAIPF